MKHRTHIIALILLFSLLFSLSACRNRGVTDLKNLFSGLTPQKGVATPMETTMVDETIQIELPSDAFLRMIESDYAKFIKRNDGYDMEFYITNYYGFYNGAVPFMAIGSEMCYIEVETRNVVADYIFDYPNGNQIVVWHNASFYTLNEAYEKEVLTKAHLEILSKAYRNAEIDDGFETYNDARRAITVLEGKTLKKVKKAYGITWDFDTIDSKLVNARCYGDFNGCIVIFEKTQLTVDGHFSVAGVEIRDSKDFNLEAYYKGEMYSLSEAYEKGFISKSSIERVAQNHNTVKRYLSWLSQNKQFIPKNS